MTPVYDKTDGHPLVRVEIKMTCSRHGAAVRTLDIVEGAIAVFHSGVHFGDYKKQGIWVQIHFST